MPVTPRVTRLQPNEELEGFEIQDASDTSKIRDVIENPSDPGDPDKHYQVTFQPGDYSGITNISVPDWVNVTVLPGADFADNAFSGSTGNVIDLNNLANGEFEISENITLDGKLVVKNQMATGDTSVFKRNLDVEEDLTVNNSVQIDNNLSVGNGASITGSLDVSGEIVATDVTETSSARYKSGIADLQAVLEKVQKLEPKTFEHEYSEGTSVGLVAEDVQEVFPELVSTDDNGDPVGVQYTKLAAVLVGAVKELSEKI